MIANVIVDVASQNTNRPFDYEIPEKFEGIVQPGVRVIVPFGPRKILGYVISLSETSSFSSVKKIADVLDVIPTLTEGAASSGEMAVQLYVKLLHFLSTGHAAAGHESQIQKRVMETDR